MVFTRRARSAVLPRAYWLLWLGTLINRLGGFVAPFLAIYLTGERGLSVAKAALVVSLFGAGSFGASLTGGELSDRLGRRPVLILSFFVTPAIMMLVGLARSVALIASSTFLLGFFTDLYRPAVGAAVADLVPPEHRTRAYGYIYWAINLGAAIAPMAAGLMARRSYLLLFAGDALTTLLFGLLVAWRIPETRPSDAMTHHARATRSPAGGRGRARLSFALRDPFVLALAALFLLFGIIYSQSSSNLPVDMQAHGVSAAQYGLAIAVNGAVIALIGIPASRAAAHWRRFGALAAGAILLGIGFGMNAFVHTLPLYILAVIIWTLGEIADSSVRQAVIADLAPLHLRGLYQGLFGSMVGLSYFLGPAAGGLLFQRVGPRPLWSACLLGGLLVAAGFFALARPASRRITALSARRIG